MKYAVWPAIAALALLAAGCTSKRVTQAPPPPPAAPQTATAAAAPRMPSVAPVPQCDASLWNHVYAGDPRRFKSPKDRLQIIQECVTVTGTIKTAKAEADGDFHVTVDLDPEYKNLLNAKNVSGQHGFLVVEPVCENPVTQADTLKEGVCNGFKQTVFAKTMIGKHVRITGAYVTDMEHGWNEIHPVSSITPF